METFARHYEVLKKLGVGRRAYRNSKYLPRQSWPNLELSMGELVEHKEHFGFLNVEFKSHMDWSNSKYLPDGLRF